MTLNTATFLSIGLVIIGFNGISYSMLTLLYLNLHTGASTMTYNNLSRGRHSVTVRGGCPNGVTKRETVRFRIRGGGRGK